MHPRRVIATPSAPAAIGPYSQAIVVGGGIFCSGQIPLDPVTGQMVEGSVSDQARRVLENLKAVLEGAGAVMGDVAKVTMFLTDLAHFHEVNQVYAEYFPDAPPARSTVQVSALPRGALVEIEAIAIQPNG